VKYSLQVILGTKKYVMKELLEKYPEISILEDETLSHLYSKRTNNHKINNKSYSKSDREKVEEIVFESSYEDVDQFYNLFSPLRITKENGITRNLFRREWKLKSAPAGINPSLAYILCMVAGVNSEDTVLDPFCGAGTIAITAAKYFSAKKVLASDLSGKAVDFTTENFKAANLSNKQFTVFRSNVTQLKLQKDSISKVITNLPFGIRVGDHEQNIKLYKAFADRMKVAVKSEGKLVLFTQEKSLLAESFNSSEFKLLDSFDVEQGGLVPRIYIYIRI
jgi:predicted RNA methylase